MVIEDILSGIEKGRADFEAALAEVEETGGLGAADTDAAENGLGAADADAAENGLGAADADAAENGLYAADADAVPDGELYYGDNLEYMKELLGRGAGGSFRLIYIDPPFFTRSSFNASVSVRGSDGKTHRIHHLAFDDKFDRSLEYYIENMTVRILMMRELLADDGLMWIHLDWHSSHYIKLVLDELMGSRNFVNEIIWCYKSGGSGKRHFARKHDTILVYSKTDDYYIDVPTEKSYNRGRKPYRFKGVREYRDEYGWYTLVNMKDVWTIDMVGRTSSERTGYATQKPLELMRRIIESSTGKGDLVGDFFCGSGSLLEAAHRLGRRWAGCDSEELAFSMTRRRLSRAGADLSCISRGRTEPLSGRADISVISTDELEDGRTLYKCSLRDLLPDIDTGSIQMKDRKYVEDALSCDRLQFADHVIIHTGPDGHGKDTPKKDTGKKDTPQKDTQKKDTGRELIFDEGLDCMTFISGAEPSAKVVDIFGKEYPAEIRMEQENTV